MAITPNLSLIASMTRLAFMRLSTPVPLKWPARARTRRQSPPESLWPKGAPPPSAAIGPNFGARGDLLPPDAPADRHGRSPPAKSRLTLSKPAVNQTLYITSLGRALAAGNCAFRLPPRDHVEQGRAHAAFDDCGAARCRRAAAAAAHHAGEHGWPGLAAAAGRGVRRLPGGPVWSGHDRVCTRLGLRDGA